MTGKKIIIAPDSFKETLSSQEVAAIISRELALITNVVCEEVPIADGGEGTVDVMVNATGGKKVVVEVEDPLGRPVKAGYGILGDGITAVVELAAASGLHLLKKEERNPLKTSTYGTGQLIVHALQTSRCKKIIIGLGGSATNDGGVGLLQALGIDFFYEDRTTVKRGGGALKGMYGASDFHLYPGVEEATFIVACDVQNTILGDNGASSVYGPQKGATPEMVEELETSLEDYVQAVETYFDQSFRDIPGTGAAGGTAYGLVAFLGAEIKPGFEVLSEVVGLEDKIVQADIVITGEGKVDRQTQEGKVVHRIIALAKKHKKKVLVIGGQVDVGVEEQYDTNVHFYSLSVAAGSIDDAINNPEAALKKVISSLVPTLFE